MVAESIGVPEVGKCAKSVTTNALIAINSSAVGNPETESKTLSGFQPTLSGKPRSAIVSADESIPVTTPQAIAAVSRSSEISTRRKRSFSKTSGERPARGYLPSYVFAWSIIDAYAAVARTPVSVNRRVIPRCQFCQFATLSERCDAHKSKIHAEDRTFPEGGGFSSYRARG